MKRKSFGRRSFVIAVQLMVCSSNSLENCEMKILFEFKWVVEIKVSFVIGKPTESYVDVFEKL